MKLCDIKIILFCHIILIHEYNKVNTFSKVLTFMANSAGYSLRISRELLDTIKYISEAEGRSMNKEIGRAVLLHIKQYEKENGPIPLEDLKPINTQRVDSEWNLLFVFTEYFLPGAVPFPTAC